MPTTAALRLDWMALAHELMSVETRPQLVSAVGRTIAALQYPTRDDAELVRLCVEAAPGLMGRVDRVIAAAHRIPAAARRLERMALDGSVPLPEVLAAGRGLATAMRGGDLDRADLFTVLLYYETGGSG